jgi:hypothetical protein
MGKVLSFVVAAVDLGIFGLLVASRHTDTLNDFGLFGSFIYTAALAWTVAFCTALVRALRKLSGWRTVRRLLIYFWLPALPALVYGMSALHIFAARGGKSSASNGLGTGTPRLTVVAAPGMIVTAPALHAGEQDSVAA